ncbi:unnamed protein product [Psylliodes chrysocephalus]|uniref:TTF-type domain-containing protein n=1 Tax=Psylliodes chrysocephalus TaxID=3402493 RepID=A0A9P0G725_9CUCU|nr:unnamed protein product [Psylliodes chrysocephala]
MCYQDRIDYKVLKRHLNIAKDQNLPAKIKGRTIEINGNIYTPNDLRKIEGQCETNDGIRSDSDSNRESDAEELVEEKPKSKGQEKRKSIIYSPPEENHRIAAQIHFYVMENRGNPKHKGSSNILWNFLKKPRLAEDSDIVSSTVSTSLQCTASALTENKLDNDEHVSLLPLQKTSEGNRLECEASSSMTSQNNQVHDKYDIANFVHKQVDDETKLQLVERFWTPPKNFVFPLEKQGQHQRKFNTVWLTKYNWLTYSKIEDGAYCKYCVLFSSSFAGHNTSQILGALVKEPFRGWKKAIGKFEAHGGAQYHRFSVLRADNLKQSFSGYSIGKLLTKSSELIIQQNRQRLTPIIKTILFCGRMGLPLRGHKDYGSLDLHSDLNRSEGNFRNILRLRAEAGDQALLDHLNFCGGNATYLSWDIQNQILEICNRLVIQKIVEELNAAKAFVILADETADVSNKEQLSICVRFVDRKDQIHEKFLQFVEITSTTGAYIAENILGTLDKLEVNCKYLCGQGYDGAAAMSGNTKGVQKLISEKFPAATYVHCASHNLNLCLSSASNVTEIRNCLGTIEKAYCFFNSPKRENVLHQKIELLCTETKKHGLKRLCPTRWVARHDAVLIFEELYKPLVAALEEIEQWPDRPTSTEASGLLASIKTSKFTIALMCSKRLYAHTLPLSKILQTIDLNLCKALALADDVADQLKQIRGQADEHFKNIFKEAQDLLSEFDIEIKMPRVPARQTQRLVLNTESASEYLKIAIFIPFLDDLIVNLEERFLNHRKTIQNFECLFPFNNQNFKSQYKCFLELHSFYKMHDFLEGFCNETILKAELELWYKKCENKNLKEDLAKVYSECDSTIFPNIKRLLQIFLTLPITTSTSERSFSNLKYLKNYLRSTMQEDRLNGLAVLYANHDIVITAEEILDEMAKTKRRILL